MNYKDMKPRIQYIVTKASDDTTFHIGDIIHIDTNGYILSQNAGGWLNKDDAEEATKGMEIKPDMEWLKRRCDTLENNYCYFREIFEDYEELIEL